MKPQAVLQDLQSITKVYQSAISFADALTAAIRRAGDFKIDGFVFKHREDISIRTDYVHTGEHRMVYELAGTGKTYEISIRPVKETHGGKTA